MIVIMNMNTLNNDIMIMYMNPTLNKPKLIGALAFDCITGA